MKKEKFRETWTEYAEYEMRKGYENYSINWKSVNSTLLQGHLLPRQISKCFSLNK